MNAGFSKRSSGISNNGLQQERKHRMRIKLVLGFWLLGITFIVIFDAIFAVIFNLFDL